MKFALIFGEQIQMSDNYDNKGVFGKRLLTSLQRDFGRKANNFLLTARAKFNKGDRRFSRGHFQDAFESYNDAFADLANLMNPDGGIPGGDLPFVDRVSSNPSFAVFGDYEYWEYARGLNSAAMYYQATGNFTRAEKLYFKALKIRGEQFGKTSEPYVCTLNNLATLKKDQGNYAAADDMFNYLINFYSKTLGTDTREYAIVLNNKAMLDAKLGRQEKAIAGLENVFTLQEKAAIFSILDIQRIQTNYALLLADEDPEQAITLLENVKLILEENDYDKHADYYIAGILLGKLYLDNGYSDVDGFIEKSIAKVKLAFGSENILYLNSLEIKADYHLGKGEYAIALATYEQLLLTYENKLGIRNRTYLDVLAKTAYCQWQTGNLDVAYENLKKGISGYLKVTDNLFKSMSEEEQSKFWRTLKPNVDLFHYFALQNLDAFPSLAAESYDLQIKTKGLLINNTKRTRETILKSGDKILIKKYRRWIQQKELIGSYYGMEKAELDAQGIDISALQESVNQLEKSLVSASKAFGAFTSEAISWKDVQRNLDEDEMAIEIERISPDLVAGEIIEYMALVVGMSGQPTVVRLGNGTNMEKKFVSFYSNAIKFKIADEKSYNWFWQPLEPEVSFAKRIYISVDGVYNNLNLNTIKSSDSSYLIDKYEYVYLTNTKFLGDYKSNRTADFRFSNAILVGNPDFGNSEYIKPLPGTLKEVNLVDSILSEDGIKVSKYTGSDANRQVLQYFGSSEVVHIATHGFFIESGKLKSRAYQNVMSESAANPLFRSGLILAGDGSAFVDGMISPRAESIVTAFETMNLELEDTKLVVLSACETGIGEVVNGEGVYGLLRSFQVAGSDATIMSLWKVDDYATQELMVNFYQQLNKTGDLSKSFREAQQKLRNKYIHPYFWGAFILHQ